MSKAPIWLCTGLLATLVFGQSMRYNVGRIATPEEIRAKDSLVSPDGTGLPNGDGTPKEGRLVYEQQCASCHGDKGQGIAPYPRLVGGQGTLETDKPVRTVGSYWPYATTIWHYVNNNMPYQQPGTLKSDEVYSVTAYLLYLNDIIAANDRMNRETLPKVTMPNRYGFIPDPRPDIKWAGGR